MKTPITMSGRPAMSRREFFRITALAGTGLAISIYLPGCGGAPTAEPTAAPTAQSVPTEPPAPTSAPQPTPPPAPTLTPTPAPEPGSFVEPNIYVVIGADGIVTVRAFRSEMGQGVRTALAMMLVEELDAPWEDVRIEQVGADPRYGDQVTGGSQSVSRHYTVVRQAGAAARQMLVQAAAAEWGVDPAACRTANGVVIGPDGQELPYGDLVEAASKLEPPDARDAPLKDPKDFTLISTPRTLYDASSYVNGSAVYGTDVRLPGMLYATVMQSPVFEGKVKDFDATAAKAIPGVRDVVQAGNWLAVVADNTWAAFKGRDALQVTWDEGDFADWSSDFIRSVLEKQAPKPPTDMNVMQAVYEIPYQAHATMEPMACTADVRADRCEVWAPTQDPQRAKRSAAGMAGLPGDVVTLHVTLIGGGFGRRHEPDFVEQAVAVSKAIGAPVRLMWTRAEDLQHDFYHPMSLTSVSARLDASGKPERMPSPRVIPMNIGVPTGAWRAVENVPQAFARESFLDEIAAKSGLDPVQLRLDLAPDPGKAVIALAAEKAGWGASQQAGSGRGIAYWATFGVTHVAQVAEVAVGEDGAIRVTRVVCAVECGQVVNPDTVAAQMEGGIAFGLTAALKAQITIDQGRTQQSNFNDYPLLAIGEMPAVEVYIVPSDRAPSGIGEMGVPPIAPAVANAVFAATGIRVRKIPILPMDLVA